MGSQMWTEHYWSRQVVYKVARNIIIFFFTFFYQIEYLYKFDQVKAINIGLEQIFAFLKIFARTLFDPF